MFTSEYHIFVFSVCNNGHEGEQEPNNLPSKKKAMDKKGNGVF